MDNNQVSAKSYRERIVGQEGIKPAKAVYKLTEKFPRQETYALADQIRRAGVSALPNIAEGQAKIFAHCTWYISRSRYASSSSSRIWVLSQRGYR